MSILDTLNSNIGAVVAFGAIGSGVLGLIVKFWSSIKIVFTRCFNMIVKSCVIQDTNTQKALIALLIKKYQRSNSNVTSYSSTYEFFKTGKCGMVSYELIGDKTTIFWKWWLPLVYSVKIEEKKDGGSQMVFWGEKPKVDKTITVYYLRWTFNIDKLIEEATKERNKLAWDNEDKGRKRFFIKKIPDAANPGQRISAGTDLNWYQTGTYNLLGYSANDLGKNNSNLGKIKNLVYPPEIYTLFNEISQWRNSREWYSEKGIPWKRGFLLYGIPGTGKSALVRAIAQELDMPLFVFSLGELTNTELQKSWHDMQVNAPCVALFEDFDNVFKGRENIFGKPKVSDLIQSQAASPTVDTSSVNHGKLSFDCLLNCIDGVDKSEGIFTCITTNHIDCIDEALGVPKKMPDGKLQFVSSRPGRIDRAIELGHIRKEEKIILAKQILNDYPLSLGTMLESIEQSTIPETPAQFSDKCIQIALQNFWENKTTIEA